MKKLSYFIFALLLLSCSFPDKPLVLKKAEALVDSLPDAALKILEENKSAADGFPTRYRMDYLLLYAMAMNKSYVSMDTVSFMPQVIRYYENHGSTGDLVTANYMMGCVFRDKGDSPMALRYFLNATRLSDVNNSDCDVNELAAIYGQIGYVFYNQRILTKAIEAWHECQKYALLAGDTIRAIQSIEYCGYSYSGLNKLDSAISIAKRVYASYKRIGDDEAAASSLGSLILYCLDTDRLDAAKKYMDDYIMHSGYFDKEGNLQPGHESFYYYLADYYERLDRLDSAEYFYRRLLCNATNYNSSENGSRGLMRIYSRKGEADSVMKYSNMFVDSNDSSSFHRSAAEVSKMQALYDYSENKALAIRESNRADRYQYLVIVLLLFLLFFSLGIYFFLTKLRKRKMRALQEINERYSDTLLMYYDAIAERDKLKSGIEKQKNSMEEEIMYLKNKLSSFSDETDWAKWDSEQSLLCHEVVMRIHKYASRGKMPSASELNSLIEVVKQSLPGFYEFLSNPKYAVSDNEMLVCILTRLHFIPSEIATLLNLTKQRISNMRSGLNKKLFKTKGTKSFTANIYRL